MKCGAFITKYSLEVANLNIYFWGYWNIKLSAFVRFEHIHAFFKYGLPHTNKNINFIAIH